MATGGLYVGGGIAPRIAARLAGGRFMARFTDKGRMRPLLESIPVRVVLNDRTALLGAARHAASGLNGAPAAAPRETRA
jgi:glucokinase